MRKAGLTLVALKMQRWTKAKFYDKACFESWICQEHQAG